MSLTYRKLIDCKCSHQYYEAGRDAFEIQPSSRTTALLQHSGLLFRQTDEGFCILYPETDSGQALRTFAKDLHLSFNVFSRSEFLNSITNLPFTRFAGTTIYGSNRHIHSAAGRLYLNAKTETTRYITEGDLRPLSSTTINIRHESAKPITAAIRNTFAENVRFRFVQPEDGICQTQLDICDEPEGEYVTVIDGQPGEPYLTHPRVSAGPRFAIIDLYAGPSIPAEHSFLDTNGAPTPKDYALSFKRRKTKWKYMVVPRFNEGLAAADLTVVDTQSRYTFKDPVTIPTITGEDAFCFESNESIPVQRENIKGINLKRNGNLVMVADMRAPNFHDIRKDGNKFCSEMFIYV